MKVNTKAIAQAAQQLTAADAVSKHAKLALAIEQAMAAATVSAATNGVAKDNNVTLWAAWRTVAAIAAEAADLSSGTLESGVAVLMAKHDEKAIKTANSYASTAIGLVEVFRAGLDELAVNLRTSKTAGPVEPDNITRGEASKLIKRLRLRTRVTYQDRARAAIVAITAALKAEMKPTKTKDKRATTEELEAAAKDALALRLEDWLHDLDEKAYNALPEVGEFADAVDELAERAADDAEGEESGSYDGAEEDDEEDDDGAEEAQAANG